MFVSFAYPKAIKAMGSTWSGSAIAFLQYSVSKLQIQQDPNPCSAAAKHKCSMAIAASISAWSLLSEGRCHDFVWSTHATTIHGTLVIHDR